MIDASFAKLNRESTRITISEFYERNQLKKYNFEPAYQRRGDVWSEEKQSFLIDSILKNYPMPPIFLHQVIVPTTGATEYNVIDGKQRLRAILKFINDEIALPSDYDVGAFGDSRLNGKKFSELNGPLEVFKMQFWRYVLSVEYIETNDVDIINNVFDRLNRNGEPLEPQELRKAKYFDTSLFKLIEELTSNINWDSLAKIKVNRMQDSEFVSELLFFLLEGEPTDASTRMNLDLLYDKWVKKLTDSEIATSRSQFIAAAKYLNALSIDFEGFKINGVSHYYALFAFSKYCCDHNLDSKTMSQKLNEFYTHLRFPEKSLRDIADYRGSMQSNTRSKAQRLRRINALIHYCTDSII